MINLNIEHLKNEGEVKEVVDELSFLIADQYLNTNIMLHSNSYWFDMVRQDKAHNPSTKILGRRISFSKNQIENKDVKKSTEETIDFFKACGIWETHKEECEKRFLESQNWTKLLTLVVLYELWECVFRKRLISLINFNHKSFKKLKNSPSLLNPTFGDLRHIRNNYLHCNGYFKRGDPKKILTVFSSFFYKGKEMKINEEEFIQIRRQILFALQKFPDGFIIKEKST